MIEMKTWTFLNKSAWPERGPWDNEPDKAHWIDPTTGLDCLMVRVHSHWCGYVGVTEEHPAFEKDFATFYDVDDLEVHGGLTFSGFCQEPVADQHPEMRVCHTPELGRTNRIWWLGFDCAHGGDKRPAAHPEILRINQMYPMPEGYETYRDFAYVQSEVTRLAQQLKSMRR